MRLSSRRPWKGFSLLRGTAAIHVCIAAPQAQAVRFDLEMAVRLLRLGRGVSV